MATENNWLTTNIKDIHKPFSVLINNPEYEIMSFEEASKIVVEKISKKYNNIYIPLSGGMDSEYVLNCFVKNNVNVTPIIINSTGNKEESSYAFAKCKEYDITPVVIYKKEIELFKCYVDEIYKKINGPGYNSTFALIATKYSKTMCGISVIGEHGYDGVNEWDFYNDAILGEEASINFFMYTPEIFYAMKRAYNNEPHQQFKSKLYGIPNRPKMTYKYTKEMSTAIASITIGIKK